MSEGIPLDDNPTGWRREPPSQGYYPHSDYYQSNESSRSATSRPDELDLHQRHQNAEPGMRLPKSILTPVSRVGGGLNMPETMGTDAGDKCGRMFWANKHTTITYCFAFWSFGSCVAILGPTLLDLGCKTSSVFSVMSFVFFAQSLFTLLGSAATAVLVQRCPPNVILFLATVMLGLTLSLIPLCNMLVLLAFVLAVMGFNMGCIDTVANISMLQLYGRNVSPFLQALHFFYGLGAFVSPMIAEPFLLNEDCSPFLDNSTEARDPYHEINVTQPAKNLLEAQKMTGIDYVFWIMALFQVPVIVLAATLMGKQLYDKITGAKSKPDKSAREDYENVDFDQRSLSDTPILRTNDSEHPPANSYQIWTLTALTALLLFMYDGLQAAFGGFIYSYAVKGQVDLPLSKAAYLNAYFWGTFAFGRLISILIATSLSPAVMLLCNILGCVFSLFVILILPHDATALYVGTCLFGMFLSSVYPSAISLAEQYINVTPTITSCMVVGAASGEMLLPVIVGFAFDHEGPLSFLVCCYTISVLSVFIFGCLCAVGASIVRYKAEPGFLGAWHSVFSQPPSHTGGFSSSAVPFRTSGSQDEKSELMLQQVKYYSHMPHDLSNNESLGETDSGAGVEINTRNS